MGRTAADGLQWMHEGTSLFLDHLTALDDESLSAPTALPGWSGRQLVAHVAANASALLNLTRWAATGVETPMYGSPEQRSADIEAGARRSCAELRESAVRTAGELDAALAALSQAQWAQTVRTAQGRTVAATEVPWMRAREVMVHAIDLDPRRSFGDLPEPFLIALIADIVARRAGMAEHPALLIEVAGGGTWSISGNGPELRIEGSLAETAAYLAGRPGGTVHTGSGPVPTIPPWL